jgi:hypothetical protein
LYAGNLRIFKFGGIEDVVFVKKSNEKLGTFDERQNFGDSLEIDDVLNENPLNFQQISPEIPSQGLPNKKRPTPSFPKSNSANRKRPLGR